MRGTEGETVASTGRAQQIDWFHHGECTTLVYKHSSLTGDLPEVPEDCSAEATAAWIKRVLAGDCPVPPTIAEQVGHCEFVAKMIKERVNLQ
jgi:anthranilate phosphoribosyltransferase